jgi:uncharacterized protein YeaO (DUF488 family)
MATDRPGRVEVRRVYDIGTPRSHGYRVLVDRLWPRGISKADAAVDEWLKDAAPSTELRRWYRHEVPRFEEFAHRYRAELTRPPAAAAVEHLAAIAEHQHLTLVTATRDVEHSGAEVLRAYVLSRVPIRP